MTGSLVTRDAQPWHDDLAAVPDNLLPAFLQEGQYHSPSQSMSQMIFKATFNASHDIVKVDIELLVDQVCESRRRWTYRCMHVWQFLIYPPLSLCCIIFRLP